MSTSRARWLAPAVLALALGLAAPAAGAPPPDPSEEITSEELATIPEPVPATPGGPGGVGDRSLLPDARAASQAPIALDGPKGSGRLWRVQVFATQDPDLADRMAKEAAERLEQPAYVAHEASQFKVRLGDYRSEEEALPLRERAIQAGFTGAFRVRCNADVSHGQD
jgi:hypothetical protein